MMKSGKPVLFGSQSAGRWAVVMMIAAMIFVIGCAGKSKTGTSSTSQGRDVVKPPTEPIKPTPPTDETINTQPKTDEENVTGQKPVEGSKSGDASLTGNTETVAGLAAVYFDFDKYDLSDAARNTLAKNAQWIKQNADAVIRVEGNCDERGTVDYNLSLGERRAKAVKDYYVSLGIPAKRVETISYGNERPLDPGHSEDAWAKNRRSDTMKVTK